MASPSVSESNFGLLIAYVLPGYTALKGLPFFGSDFSAWSVISPTQEATIAGFLTTSIEAIFAGLTVSLLRWLVIDSLHHWSGLKPPSWDFATLEKRTQAFELLIQSHYRYYKFYANMVVALFWSFAAVQPRSGWAAIAYWLLAALFTIGSRDALKKYYDRAGQLLTAKADSETLGRTSEKMVVPSCASNRPR